MPAGRRRCPWHSGTGSRPMGGCTCHARCRGSMRGASTRGHRSRRWPGRLLAPFFDGDRLAPALEAIAAESLDVAAPVVSVQDGTERLAILELFHGPTAAFKDFGARFLAACLARLREPESPTLTVLVATSGDTGAAVAAAFHGRPGVRVVVLYPEGRVSPIQEQQLTGWDGNVRSLAVQGSFDDCQRLVKQAFADADLRERFALTSANSINIGRLLPQVVLFASAALAVREATGAPVGFVIPSGNLGLATACVYAREMGLPVGEIVLAHNANRTVPDFMADGSWRPRASVATLASAMDVGDPSNMERLFALYPDAAALRRALRAVSVDDAAIRESIRAEFQRGGVVACPHTAAGLAAYRGLPERGAPRVALGRRGDRPSGEVPGDRRAAGGPARRAARRAREPAPSSVAARADRPYGGRARRSTRGSAMLAVTDPRRRVPMAADVVAAAARIRGQVIATPCLHSPGLSSATGAEIHVKFENRQVTSSFKERGALNFLLQLGERARARGVADRVRRQSRAGGRVPCPAPRDAGGRGHAPPHAVREGRADAGARRGGRAAGRDIRRGLRARARARRLAPHDAGPSLRRPGRHDRAGHGGARDARGRARQSTRSSCRWAAAA